MIYSALAHNEHGLTAGDIEGLLGTPTHRDWEAPEPQNRKLGDGLVAQWMANGAYFQVGVGPDRIGICCAESGCDANPDEWPSYESVGFMGEACAVLSRRLGIEWVRTWECDVDR